MSNDHDTVSIRATSEEIENGNNLYGLFNNSPLGEELLTNLHLYMNRQTLMRILFFQELYQKVVNIHGNIFEFGCKWGSNLSLFTALRGIYEPYNHNRKVIGFDTFSGLNGITEKDKESKHIQPGFYSTGDNYENHLSQVLSCLEKECPISHIKKNQIIKGDVRETLPDYLNNNPQTVIAFAYFDMDIYEPTLQAMKLIKPYLTKGSIIGIDEMNWDEMPGPTLAFREVFGDMNYSIQRTPMQPIPGYIVIE